MYFSEWFVCLYYIRRVSNPANQNASCPQSRGGGCQVFEGGASQTRQHVETGQEPDRRPRHSEKVGGRRRVWMGIKWRSGEQVLKCSCRVHERELKMKSKKGFLKEWMMWAIVLFDYTGRPAFIASKRSFCVDRRMRHPARFTSATFTEPISDLIWRTLLALFYLWCHTYQNDSWL